MWCHTHLLGLCFGILFAPSLLGCMGEYNAANCFCAGSGLISSCLGFGLVARKSKAIACETRAGMRNFRVWQSLGALAIVIPLHLVVHSL